MPSECLLCTGHSAGHSEGAEERHPDPARSMHIWGGGGASVGCGNPLCVSRWQALTFFGHEGDEAAPDLHPGGLDLTLARWCPSADTQDTMSHPTPLGAHPECVPLGPPTPCSHA